MNFRDLFCNVASDNVLLASTADYFSAKVESCISLVQKLSDIASHAGEQGYILPSIIESIGVEINGVATRIDPDSFASHLFNEDEKYTEVINGEEVEIIVDDVINQLSDSLAVNRCMVESLYALKEAAGEKVSDITSLFMDRLQMKIGQVTETMSSIGSQFLDLLTQKGKSVGDRVKDLLGYIGLYNVPDAQPAPNIGFPGSELQDLTGANVYTAWFAAAPKTVLELYNWIVDTVKKTLALLKGLLNVVLGSSLYRSVKKIFSTLALQADAFAYNGGEEEGITLGSHGYWCKIAVSDYNVDWLQYDLSTIQGVSYALGNIRYNSVHTYSDITDALTQLCDAITSISIVEDGSPLKQSLSELNHPYSTPGWITDMINSGDNIANRAARIYARLLGGKYGQIPQTSEPLFDMLSASLGVILDILHINDNARLTDHLESDSYLKIDLPCSSLYLWLVGSEVVMTRRVSVIPFFLDKRPNWSAHDTSGDFNYRNLFVNPQTGKYSWKYFSEFISQLRTGEDKYAENDQEIYRATWWATAVDALFISMVIECKRMGYDFDDDIPDFATSNAIGYASFYLIPALTGFTSSQVANWYDRARNLDSTAISNKELAWTLGCYNSGGTYNDSNLLVEFLQYVFVDIDSDITYIPYVHTDHIDYGRYHIITDSELSNIFSTTIKVVIAIAATIFVLTKVKSMKKQALSARTVADATAWELVTKGKYTASAVNAQYKLIRKAEILDKLSSAIFTAIPSVVKNVGSSIQSFTTSIVSSVKEHLSGTLITSQDKVVDLTDIARLIKHY